MQNAKCKHRQCTECAALRVDHDSSQYSRDLFSLSAQPLNALGWTKFESKRNPQPVHGLARLAKGDLNISDELAPGGRRLGFLKIRTDRRGRFHKLVDNAPNTGTWRQRHRQLHHVASEFKRSISDMLRGLTAHDGRECIDHAKNDEGGIGRKMSSGKNPPRRRADFALPTRRLNSEFCILN